MIFTPEKVPFDQSLFFGALVHLVGKEPYGKVNHGDSGYYDFYWFLDKKELRELHIEDIPRWMNYFNLKTGECRCDIAYWDDLPKDSSGQLKRALRVTINHEIKKGEN